MQVDKHAKPCAATVPTVTMETCAIFIMLLRVSVNLAQEKMTQLALSHTAPPVESLNAKVFVSDGKKILQKKILQKFLHKSMIVKLGLDVELAMLI